MTLFLVMINNYFHDLATGVLFGAAVAMWAVGRFARDAGDKDLAVLRRVYPPLSRLALVALVWTLVGGVPRTIFFSQVELNPAIAPDAAAYILPALLVKHVLLFTAVGLGIWMWWRTKRLLEAASAEER
jgi:hypothetical protein